MTSVYIVIKLETKTNLHTILTLVITSVVDKTSGVVNLVFVVAAMS